ncbi:hypothetical protein N7495_003277 [Penicillium taxi]|uniref:uncharacterized protein n=1 Tax=Penicillium taxi TaxID=168475 RepID=UPI002544F936|nr:uncharacterized protein N7495_003277 [Penicillium taxi]KAJ5902749.1 hypothetical protein N7495_003277 [Penicillium taxi]
MPNKTPTLSDFPSRLTVTVTLPPPPTSNPAPNILILLHGIGDSSENFSGFARALRLAETTIVTVQAPTPLPFDLGGFHWGDDIAFDTSTGGLDMDVSLTSSTKMLVNNVIRDTLIKKCGYRPREIMILGFGQGGMAALVTARELEQSAGEDVDREPLSGVISIGAPYPLAGLRSGSKNRSPVLLVGGRDSTIVSDAAVLRTKEVFEFVELSRYARKGDTMPSNYEEMAPVMRFFARRLRSQKGVPEGSVELG